MPDTTIKDIWFRSKLSLPQIAERLGFSDLDHDGEDHWEWVIGTFHGESLDITRRHCEPPADVDVRIFRLDNAPFDTELKAALVTALSALDCETICCGRWTYLSGNDFGRHLVESHSVR